VGVVDAVVAPTGVGVALATGRVAGRAAFSTGASHFKEDCLIDEVVRRGLIWGLFPGTPTLPDGNQYVGQLSEFVTTHPGMQQVHGSNYQILDWKGPQRWDR
jgi:hypothetical protein